MAAPAAPLRTTCPYCGVGCGLVAEPDGRGGLDLRGDRSHPANAGRLCSKGAALAETLDDDGRLLYPEVDGQRVDWDAALAAVAEGFRRVIRRHGPEAVAFYVSGQLLTEDYYVANKLMKGFIGSANIDTNSRLCMASTVAGQRRAFGSDTVPCEYADLEAADLVVLVGSNTAWCHPVLYQRLAAARAARPDLRVIAVDPRRTPTCELADRHLALAPGSDVALFNGLLAHLERQGLGDEAFLSARVTGVEEALAAARREAPDATATAARCGLAPAEVAAFFRDFAAAERVVTVFSQGVNQSSQGTDKVNAIINCHLYTGRIGRPGMGPFSLTGQPNAMGGREVGGLANQLAAHMDLEDAAARARVQDFWGSPRMADRPGCKAVDLFEAVGAGRIRALWIMGSNPAVSLPDADRVARALAGCEFLVVSDCVRETDTTRYARVLLPAAAWGEKDGTVTNSERCISRQRPFRASPGEARPDWWMICQVARRLGHGDAFDYEGPWQIFAEHARLSGLNGRGAGGFDITGLVPARRQDYDAMAPVRWPAPAGRGGGRPFAGTPFHTADGRARMVAVSAQPPRHRPGGKYPLVLNTGRCRDQWHTMTRTGMAPRLAGHRPEPYVEVHPRDLPRGVADGDLVELRTPWGAARVRVQAAPDLRPGTVFAPMHWNDRFASRGRIGALVNPVTDPVSGEPEFKHTPARLDPWPPAWQALLLSRRRLVPAGGSGIGYWALSRGPGLWHHLLAGRRLPGDWSRWARDLLCEADAGPSAGWIEYFDPARGCYRAARLLAGRLESCLFVGPREALPAPESFHLLFRMASLPEGERRRLLGAAPAGDHGPLVCACAGLRRGTLLEAIRAGGVEDLESLAGATGAGGRCGSCRPELAALLRTGRKDRDAA